MAVNSSHRTEPANAAQLAAAARSILACPGDVHLVVDGVDDIAAGLDADGTGDGGLDLRDIDGPRSASSSTSCCSPTPVASRVSRSSSGCR